MLETVHENNPEVQDKILNAPIAETGGAYIAAGGILPVNLPKAFNNAAPLPQNAPANVSAITQQNDGRAAVAEKGLKQVDGALNIIDNIAKGTQKPDAQKGGGSLTGTFARTAALVMAAAVIPAVRPALAAAEMVNTASAFRPAAESKSTLKDKTGKSADSGYKAIAPVPGTMEHAAKAAMNQIDTKGMNAFADASRKASRGPAGLDDGLHERRTLASSDLNGFKSLKGLKTVFEQKRDQLVSSLDNSGEIKGELKQRKQKGVALNEAVVGQLLKTGGTINASGMAFGKNLTS